MTNRYRLRWLRRTGGPVVRLANVHSRREGEVYAVTAEVIQEGAPYRLRVPIVLEGRDGSTSRSVADVSGAVSTVSLALKSPPRRLRLDPDGTVLLAGAETANGEDPLGFDFAGPKAPSRTRAVAALHPAAPGS